MSKLNLETKKKKLKPKKQILLNRLCLMAFIFAFLFFVNFLIDGIFNVNIMSIVANKLFSGTYTEEVKNIEIESDDYSSKAGGSWHIDKSAMWTGRDTAKVTFNLNTVLKTGENYKDIILVFDMSGSMSGEKIERAKSDAIELVNYILSDSNNRIALITFDDNSEIASNFTNDKAVLTEKLNAISATGGTNYNIALQNIDTVMSGYTKESNRDIVALFLTDGYPCVDTPNQVGTYATLKDKYPYMSINGVQYEMGTDIIKEIKDITDYQYVADTSTLNNVLFEASVAPEVYENFEIVDYIDNDYFTVESVNDIKVSAGTVTLEEENGVQKITWNLGDNSFLTGGSATMNISLKLKAEYSENGGYYPTNNKESVTYKLPEENEKVVNSSKTPVLKNSYNVIYDTNPPAECSSIKEVTEEEHFVYENVTKRSDKLSCDGYLFKGWEVVENVTKVNDDMFVMPESDVNVRGTWTKQSIAKSMDGTVYVAPNLYNVVKNDAINSKGAVLYTGNGSDTFANDVYYYNGDASATNNNVIFGGFCWKIVRTTDTGGVKLVYNGVPTDGTCNNTGTASQIGTSAFNSSYNSPAYVGYRYNATSASNYSYKSKSYSTLNVLSSTGVSSTNYYYGDTVEYDGSNYVLKNSDGSEVSQKLWSSNYSTLTGYYTCRSTTATTCSTVYYVAAGTNSTQYTVILTGGKSLDDVNTMTLGSSITKNGDGTYTLNNPVTITKSDWYKNYSTYRNYYICSDQVSTTCSDMYSIASSSNYRYNYYSSLNNKYLYGNSFTYEDGKYKLIDTKEVWDWNVNYNQINNNHYTCFNETGECTTLSYVYYAYSSYANYINLTGGKSVEDALNEMLWDDNVNDKDSTIKEVIDDWYEKNMIKYTDKLEDTVFCNDRSISSLGGWDPNGGDVTQILDFGAYGRYLSGKYDLTCPNKNDRFTMSTSTGNGKLVDKPIGLLTADEAGLMGASQLTTGQWYWLGSPFNFYNNNAREFYVYYTGGLSDGLVYSTYGVRPAVSLKPGTMYSSGDGSFDSPYVVLTD